MLTIKLPDGSHRQYDQPVTALAVAESIGAGLARAALAAKVNDQLVDTSFLIESDSDVAIITAKDPEGLEVLRHSAAHLLAHAVKNLYPTAQVTIGPVIEDGFYYDFAYERPFTPEDLEKIEAKMHELAKADYSVTREPLSREAAITLFKDMGEDYKVRIIEDLPENEALTVYRQDDFVDLCRGPHVPSTGRLQAFKLTKFSGAYWRGDSKNEMLQRIYGTAWPDKKALKAYLQHLEEAEKRDHRKIAKKMNLCHFQQEAPGCVFWHPNGWQIVQTLRHYIREVTHAGGYQEVNTPQLVDVSLWEKSGHLAKFSDDIFLSQLENRTYAIKPMSCPGHVQVFNQGLKSYRDLPIRYAEFGHCHRSEPSGTLHGLLRVRSFVQDDGHIFCTEDQIAGEVAAFIDQIFEVYKDLAIKEVTVMLSTRPENRVGSEETWDRAEQALAAVLDEKGVQWQEQPGEGAFYGPKIEFSMRDCLRRVWTLGTVQLDFSMPLRLGAHYVAEDGSKKVPVMLHRAILGSLERFIGILLEEYAGHLPLWLAPVQVVVMGITDRHSEYIQKITNILQKNGILAKSDLRNEKIGFKIRGHTIARVPYQVVIGDRELADKTLAVRSLGGERSETVSVEQFVSQLQTEIAQKGRS